MLDEVIVIGGGGHAKVVMDCICAAGDTVFGILDDNLSTNDTVLGFPVLEKRRILKNTGITRFSSPSETTTSENNSRKF